MPRPERVICTQVLADQLLGGVVLDVLRVVILEGVLLGSHERRSVVEDARAARRHQRDLLELAHLHTHMQVCACTRTRTVVCARTQTPTHTYVYVRTGFRSGVASSSASFGSGMSKWPLSSTLTCAVECKGG